MSEVKLAGRKIKFFRCHIDPSIGPKPKNAFDPKEMLMKACEITPIGIYCQTVDGREHIVPWPNIQKIELIQEEVAAQTSVLPKEKILEKQAA